jgi:hypothetical protein
MSEVFFVIKTFIVTLLVVFVLQFKVGGLSLENHLNYWLKQSTVAQYAQSAATGALLAIQNGLASAQKKAREMWSETGKRSTHEKAGK